MTTETDARERLVRRIIGVLLGIVTLYCACWAVRIAQIGWSYPILDMHGARQTQTAISSFYMQQGSGGLLHYETPVLGSPWEIPFEFPLYQYIVAVASNVLHTPLEQTGRGVSEFFWVATLLLFWPLLGELHVRPAFRPVFLILLLVSPEYLFWSRTFSMESTVLFLGVAYLLFILRYLRLRHPRELLFGTLLGTLTALVKITTLPAFTILGLCPYIAFLYRAAESPTMPGVFRAAVREALPLLLLFGLPLLAGVVWTVYTNAIRMQNPLCNPYMSTAALRPFTFGHLHQRFQAETWDIFLNERVRDAIGSIRLPLLAIACFALSRIRWREGLLSLAAYLTPLLVFTNLFVLHNYYAYANSLFLACFVGFGILALLEKKSFVLRGIAILLLGYAIFVSLQRYENQYRQAQEYNDTILPAVGRAIRAHTDPDELMVAMGLGWSPAVPFYAERRALMIPNWAIEENQKTVPPLIEQRIESLAPRKVGAVAVCMDVRANRPLIRILQKYFGLQTEPVFINDMCTVYDLAPATPARSHKQE